MIAAAGRSGGMTTMMADGLAKCQAGITSIEEVARTAIDL
jgi:general secretion pathway protein E